MPLALSRLQNKSSARLPHALRNHRPSLPLASLQEAVDENPRRFSDEPHTPDTDDDEAFLDCETINASPQTSNGRRASDAAYAERYRKIKDFDVATPENMPRRASVAVTPGAVGIMSPPSNDKGRRRSWAARLQLDRKKRRKSGGIENDEDGDPVGYVRQKRPSWWNVFVPENVLKNRNRRASQQLSRSAESIDQPIRRSKSRSVDHGFAAPFDLEALRSKVEGRFDAVNKDEEEQAKRLPPPPPIKTMPYTVRDRDTLTSLAARFDTTPSELTKLNRLATQFIFPGQTLLVPDKKKDGDKESDGPSESGDNTSESTQGATSEAAHEKDFLDSLRPVSPEAPVSAASVQKFLKINVRHITDGQGVVSGVLLVTPNAVMFDPNVSDQLVLEYGPEKYGVIAPMEYVVNAAIFYDIMHMRSSHEQTKEEQAEIYYINKAEQSPEKDSLLVKDETFPELQAATGEANEERPGSGDTDDRGGAAFPKAFDRELVTPTALQQQTAEERRKSLLDHHWAIPSKDRMSIDQGSEVSSSGVEPKDESIEGSIVVADRAESAEVGEAPDEGGQANGAQHLVKLSYHDSGIDIRDPLLNVNTNNTKKVYSDADIVLSADWVPPVCLPRAEPPLSAPPLGTAEERPARKAAVSFSLDGNQQKDDIAKPDKKNKMLKRLSYPLSWMEGLTGENAAGSQQGSQSDSMPNSADSHNSTSVFSKVFNRRSSLGGFVRGSTKSSSTSSNPPRLDYRSMVSMDEMPDLFASFDKLIPRPARPSDDPPLYLSLRMGKPAGRPLPRTTQLMSYGRKRMKPQYWFSIPRNRVDDLFKFLTHWVPDRYGPLGDVAARGYELIDSDTEWEDDEGRPGQKVLSMSEELRQVLYSTSIDVETPPELIGTSEIMTVDHRIKLCGVLPPRAQGYMWSLTFSSSQHGFSLASMYRKMQRVESPVLLVIQDTQNNVFGALTSCALHPSEHFYGTGESLLFSFQRLHDDAVDRRPSQAAAVEPAKDTETTKQMSTDDETKDTVEEEKKEDEPPPVKTKFKHWGWTGDNMYFIRGSSDNISIGAGNGKFGLWLDGDLYLGRTQRCTTYENEPLTTREDFVVKTLECWTFI